MNVKNQRDDLGPSEITDTVLVMGADTVQFAICGDSARRHGAWLGRQSGMISERADTVLVMGADTVQFLHPNVGPV